MGIRGMTYPFRETTLGARARDLAGTARELGERAQQAGTAVNNAAYEARRAVRRSVRNGRFAAEDAKARTEAVVRRRPLQSLAVAFAYGIFVGGAALYAIGQVRKRA
jgi:ElaB/YqjD/DUF883 family membrane-anchored ribosome-binding protein